MKILQVNNVYGEKSTGKLTKLLHEGLLREGHSSLVVYGRGRDTDDPGVIRLCPEWYGKGNGLLSRITGLPYGGCLLSTLRLQRIILREKPDAVHLQCVNGHFVNVYRLISWLKNQEIPTVISLHAEFLYTGSCGHAFDCGQWQTGCRKCPDPSGATGSWLLDRTRDSWKKMYNAFRGFEAHCVICPVSPWTEQRAEQSRILKDFSFCTVLNGVDETVFFPAEEQRKKKTVLNVTAHFSPEPSHAKGGWYLTELARRMPDVTFQVAGRADPCCSLPENLTLLGEITDQKKLAQLYRQAELTVLVSRRETFSMPCAESLCCGTPVVGFEAGAPEQIALPQYSEFVPFGDLEALERGLRTWLGREVDSGKLAEAAGRAYSADAMVQNYLKVYEENL